MNFGGVTTQTKAKYMAGKSLDYIIEDHFIAEKPYYLFLLEGKPATDRMLKNVKDQIDKAGYESYIIAACTNGQYVDGDVKQKYDYIKSNQTGWRSLIIHQNQRVEAIMAFGGALYAINKGTDLMVDEFYETKMMKPYYYMGHGFIGDYDTFIFPVDGVEKLYPIEYKKGYKFRPDESNVNFRTRYFFEQLENMQKSKELPMDMRDYRIVTAMDKPSIKQVLLSLVDSKVLAWDTETGSDSHENGLLWYREDSHIHCFTFCNDGETGYYCDAKTIFEDQELRELLLKVFYSCATMVGANIKFDLHYLRWHMPEFDMNKVLHIDDTGQLIHAINSDVRKGLKASAFRYTYFGGYDDELDVYKNQTKIQDYGQIPFQVLHKYATIDAIVTYRIFFAMLQEIDDMDRHFPNEKNQYLPQDDQWTAHRWYDEVMQEAYPCFVDMEHNGMRIDRDYLLEVRKRLQERIPVVNEKLCSIWNVPLNFKFNSPVELGKQIEKMGWPKVQESEAGNYATNDDCIQEWKRQNQPGINELIELRLLSSILNTFIGYPVGNDQNDAKGWEYFITYHPEDNSYRVHQSYQILGTTTYRCIGNDPNLQNIPVHADIANEVKRCITVATAKHFKIESDDGNVYEGGVLDTVEVEGKGRISLGDVTEDDNIIPGSFEHFHYEHEECFEACKDKDFVKALKDEYGGIADHWCYKYGDEETKKEFEPKVTRRIISRPAFKFGA